MNAEFSGRFELRAWSAATCNNCGQLEAVRIEQMVQDVSILTRHVYRMEMDNWRTLCNFCETPIALDAGQRTIPANEWDTWMGLRDLFDLLAPGANVPVPDAESPQRLHAWRRGAAAALWPHRVSVVPGLALGALLGALVSTPLGCWLVASGRIPLRNNPNWEQIICFSALCGMVPVGLLGGVFSYFSERRKVADEWVRRACDDFGIRCEALERVVWDHGALHQAVLDYRSRRREP